MILANTTADITLGQAGLYAILGYAVVFFGLILLMIVVLLLGRAFLAASKKAVAEQPAEPVVSVEIAPKEAPGAAGQLKLHNVDPKTAALLMAITADKMGKPINELRFLSIQEVEK